MKRGATYRQRPNEVSAIQWDGDARTYWDIRAMFPDTSTMPWLTTEGALVAGAFFVGIGQWIVATPSGPKPFAVLDDAEFCQRYEPIYQQE